MSDEIQHPSDKLDRYIVRFPKGMREQLGVLARANGRSVNAEIVKRLEQSLAGTKTPLLIVNENTAAADILMELPDSIKAVLDEIADLKATILNPRRGR